MSLPTPNLDDRTFQDLVDDAKRLVQQRCPEWTDHNVSDPGVVMLEAVATMVDQLLYRLNRVPERHHVKFLDLIGLRLQPATAARTDVTFHLSAPQDGDVVIPDGTEVTTVRTEADEPVRFSTESRHVLRACALSRAVRRTPSGKRTDVTKSLQGVEPGFLAFQAKPAPDDELLIGLTQAVPGCLIRLAITCEAEGVGVDPTDPPIVWESWNGGGWEACELDRDTTGGFNVSGVVDLHVPHSHVTSVIEQHRAGWIRCRVRESRQGQAGYSDSPKVQGLRAATVGGTCSAIHASVVDGETVGMTTGVPAQKFQVEHTPVAASDDPRTLRVGLGEEGWTTWEEVVDFSLSGPTDAHFMLDTRTGLGQFGPAIRQADGSFRQHGAVPSPGSTIVMGPYRLGGGRAGNVAANALRILRSSVPFVERVENRAPAVGGVDAETMAEATDRAPIYMRTRGRCVTFEDYEQVARDAAPEASRVRCLAVDADDPTAVRLIVVPPVTGDAMQRRFEHLVPSDDLLERIADSIEPRRVIGALVRVQPAAYQGVTVVARLTATPLARASEVRERALHALTTVLDPVEGGGDGRGWPFGRALQMGEVYGLLQAVPGVDLVDDIRLFPADPVTGKRGADTSRVELDRDALLFGFEHQVKVEGGQSA